jgi:hypothetical protein
MDHPSKWEKGNRNGKHQPLDHSLHIGSNQRHREGWHQDGHGETNVGEGVRCLAPTLFYPSSTRPGQHTKSSTEMATEIVDLLKKYGDFI